MKFKILFPAFLLLLINFSSHGQSVASDSLENEHWTHGGSFNLSFNQVGLNNWVGGGQSSIATGFLLDLFAKFENAEMAWDNRLRSSYGLMRIGNRAFPVRKTDDLLELQSRYSKRINKRFSVSGIIHYWTQFDYGYTYEKVQGTDDETRNFISEFMAPGFLQALIGYTYQRKEFLTITLSPLTGKFTFVLNDSLSNAGAYGVEEGNKVRFEGGASAIVQLRKNLTENIALQTNLNLFGNYELGDPLDVNWETLLKMRVHKHINTTVSTHLIYDDDIHPGIQFKHVFNIGFEYKFL